MFTVDEYNKYYRRSLHRQIKNNVSHSRKLSPGRLKHPDKDSPEYRKNKCEQTSKCETEVSYWMTWGSSGPLEPLLMPIIATVKGCGQFCCSSHSRVLFIPSQNSSSIWFACSAFRIQWLVFPVGGSLLWRTTRGFLRHRSVQWSRPRIKEAPICNVKLRPYCPT